jgi:hypothetical protein
MKKIQSSLASWPMASHQDALRMALAGAFDPVFGRLAIDHVQLVPQNRGLLTTDVVEELQKMAPEAKFRVHANVRVLKEYRNVNLTNAHEYPEYCKALAKVHLATKACVYTAHSGERKQGSWQQTIDNIKWLQDLLGCDVAVEGQYPTRVAYHLATWREYAALLESGLSYVIDLSHLNILRHKSGMFNPLLVAELVSSAHCVEVHISDNDGTGDHHAPCTTETWWFPFLEKINPDAVIFSEGNLKLKKG